MNLTTSLKVLMVEDSPADAELLLRELRRLERPIEHRRVCSEQALAAALDDFAPDVVLSDYSMPGFGGHDALQIVLERAPRTPFLFVSGTIGEERAIEALQRGAWDYVLKENLRRLPTSIERALRMAAERDERARIQRALRESEERFRSIVEGSNDWIWETDPQLRVTYSNPAITGMLGYRPEELQGRSAEELLEPAAREEMERRLPDYVAARRRWHRWRLAWRHRDGRTRLMESTGHPLFDDDGALRGFRGINHDVTERLEQEAHIRRLARIHAVLSAVGNIALRTMDRDELLLAACRVAVEQGGFKAAGVGVREGNALRVARTYGDRALLATVAPDEAMDLGPDSPFRDHPSLRAFRNAEVVAIPDYAKASGEVPAELRALMLERGVRSQISLPVGAPPWGLLALYSDAARVYDAEEFALLQRLADEIDYAVDFLARGEQLQFLAHHNPATGLPNRIPFHQKVEHLLRRGPVAVVAIDVQQFDRLRNSRGREFGDALLAAIGQRLRDHRLRAFIAHPEADTFLACYPAPDGVEAEFERLQAWLAELAHRPLLLQGERVHVDLRAGIALGPLHGGDADTLERNAIAALAEAAELGEGLRSYSSELRQRLGRRLQLEHDLRRAIDERQFELHYQPKFDANTGRLAGAEALLRWRHPGAGLVSPAEFIPVLEETGLLVDVGRWVMHEAIAMARTWREQHPGLRLAVNVSARELRQADFLDSCRALLGACDGGSPIDIEVTESVLVDDVEQSTQLLQGLRDFGCRVAIDDFGTGYSSLNYLVRLPVDTLKIDRSFVSMLQDSPETVTLVTNTITLAHSLGMDVVAEGVETDAQAQLLRELGCELLQGYLLGRPLPADAFASRFLSA